MIETLTIGASPAEEDCAQLGRTPDFQRLNRLEVDCYQAALVARYGPPPAGTAFARDTSDHDFGRYTELALRFESVGRSPRPLRRTRRRRAWPLVSCRLHRTCRISRQHGTQDQPRGSSWRDPLRDQHHAPALPRRRSGDRQPARALPGIGRGLMARDCIRQPRHVIQPLVIGRQPLSLRQPDRDARTAAQANPAHLEPGFPPLP